MENNYKWFKNAKRGLMIHWGLYSILGGEYKGEVCGNYAEWIQSYFKIPNKEMEKLTKIFNPIFFDAESWVKFAKKYGFKYIIFTAKHHDGFAMYNSKCDKYNICKMTPFKRDVLKELADACEKYKLKLGIYYSQDIDWHEKNGGGFNTPVIDCAGKSWCNNWDFKDKNKNFNKYFYKKSICQIKELLTNYKNISLFWFDMPLTLSKSQSKEIYDLVKKMQPNCLINSRLGNGEYDYVNFGDNEIPNNLNQFLDDINYNDVNGIKKSKYGLYEACVTLNQSWGYTCNPIWKSKEELTTIKNKTSSLNINLLVNIGPDALGRFPYMSTNLIKKVFAQNNVKK